jgi:hypothetical protein
MNSSTTEIQKHIHNAYRALQRGDRLEARRLAQQAAILAPDQEEPWLLLAAVAEPKASLEYLNRALDINPQSQRAREGMHWAIQRLRARPQKRIDHRPQILVEQPTASSLTQKRPIILTSLLPILFILFVLIGAFVMWYGTPTISRAFSRTEPISIAQVEVGKITRTPTPTSTFTPTPTFTPTSTPTKTPTPTNTPTNTATSTATSTPLPTDTPPPPPPPEANFPGLPDGVEPGERWIEVNLTNQTASAYEGKNLINSFVVSTGTWLHPTVTGTYRIYVKYKYADMAGPGYYLPDVPNVMYFYKGYGLHGTYWHNNFGTPMSHGCVNFTIPDSEWIFNFVSVGTVVYVHY